MKTNMFAAAAVAALLGAGAASADTIDFGQFGVEGTFGDSPLTGVTTGGVGFVLVGPGFYVRGNQGSLEHGDFVTGTKEILQQSAGQSTFYFNTPISDLKLYVESNRYGSSTETISAYDNLGNALESISYVLNIPLATLGAPGTDPGAELTATGIDHVVVTSTHDDGGLLIAGALPPTGGVPEPATWALMLVGFAGMGVSLRSRTRAIAGA